MRILTTRRFSRSLTTSATFDWPLFYNSEILNGVASTGWIRPNHSRKICTENTVNEERDLSSGRAKLDLQ